MTCGAFEQSYANARTLTLGSSIFNCTSWDYTGSNLTVTANTATINCSGNFAGGGITTYNIVNLTGATSTISGSNTFAELNLASGTTQTITFTDVSTQTVTDADLGGTAGFIHTLTGTGVAGWAITKAGGGYIIADYLDLSYSTGVPVDTWSYWTHSTVGAGVIDWGIPLLYISIDGVEQDYVWVPGISVPDNDNDWTDAQAAVMPYVETVKKWVDGILVQSIAWEYGATFTDLSGNGNDATPTFRTASSDADVSAVMASFLPIEEAKAPDYVLSQALPFIDADALTGNITAPITITPPVGGFPLAGVIAAVANATSTPAQLPLLIIAAFIILAASLVMSATLRKSGSGTLLVKIITITAFMGIFIALQNFGVDFWMLLIFLIMSIAIAMASRQLGWT